MSLSLTRSMDTRCAVCGDFSTRSLGLCPNCHRPCHSKCSGRKKGAPCDLCRSEEPQKTTSKASKSIKPKPTGAQVSARASLSQRRTPNSSITPHHRAPLGSSTPAINLSSRNGSAHTSSSLSINSAKSVGGVAGAQGRGEPERAVGPDNCPQAPKIQLSDSAQRNSASQAGLTLGTGTTQSSPFQPTSLLHNTSPLAEISEKGVENILIPVTTMDLLFQRFDMLERQLDDLKSLESRRPVSPGMANSSSQLENNSSVTALAMRVTALEGLISNQNSLLESLNETCKLLLEENSTLRLKLDNAPHSVRNNIHNTCDAGSSNPTTFNCHQPSFSPSRPCLGISVAGSGDSGAESREVILNGVLKRDCEITSEVRNDIAFAVLSTVLPSFKRENVLGTRDLGSRGTSERAEKAGESLASSSGAPRSCVVNLGSADLVREVMRAKRALSNNYLTTSDIKSELLRPESAACMPRSKIFLNEMLPREKFLFFKSLRPIAQGLGFRYVWHAGGRFLARRKGGERAHVFASAADLQAIQTACQSAPKQHPPLSNSSNDVVTSNNTADKRPGAAQVVEPALTS